MSVIEWLLDEDTSIRWQVLRDLIGESDASVRRDRLRVAAEGWARLLDLQGADGHWGDAAFVPHAWISTNDTLQTIARFRCRHEERSGAYRHRPGA
jgi:hypothetical protein